MFSISHLEEVFPMGLIKVETSLFTVELPSFTCNPRKLFVSFCLQIYRAIRIFPSLNGLPCCCCRTQNCAHCRSNHPYSPCALTSYMRIIPKGGGSSVSKLCIYPRGQKKENFKQNSEFSQAKCPPKSLPSLLGPGGDSACRE